MSLHIFSKQTKIDFVGMRHYAYGLSALLILVGLITIFMNGGLRYGVDFAGGAAGLLVMLALVQLLRCLFRSRRPPAADA